MSRERGTWLDTAPLSAPHSRVLSIVHASGSFSSFMSIRGYTREFMTFYSCTEILLLLEGGKRKRENETNFYRKKARSIRSSFVFEDFIALECGTWIRAKLFHQNREIDNLIKLRVYINRRAHTFYIFIFIEEHRRLRLLQLLHLLHGHPLDSPIVRPQRQTASKPCLTWMENGNPESETHRENRTHSRTPYLSCSHQGISPRRLKVIKWWYRYLCRAFGFIMSRSPSFVGISFLWEAHFRDRAVELRRPIYSNLSDPNEIRRSIRSRTLCMRFRVLRLKCGKARFNWFAYTRRFICGKFSSAAIIRIIL